MNTANLAKSFEEVEAEIRKRWVVRPIIAIVFYGSRVRGVSRPDSDWDVVVFVDSERPIETRIITQSGIDVLEIAWSLTTQSYWHRRELCACLMTQGRWVPAEQKPSWHVDWTAIAIEKQNRLDGQLRKLALYGPHLSEWQRRKLMSRVRQWAVRVDWMQKNHEILSTPEVNALWEKMTLEQRRTLIFAFTPEPEMCEEICRS